MTPSETTSGEDRTVRDRLIRAADLEIAENGVKAIQMEMIAKRVGVSRATAFRQLGSVAETLVQVALLRARRHVAAVEALMSTKTGAFARLEAALIYTTKELPTDPTISELIAQRSASVRNPLVHQVAVDAVGPVLREGQHNGEVRTDLEVSELVDFLVEQTYLAAEDADRSETEVRRRFRHFIAPALMRIDGSAGGRLSWTREAEAAVHEAIDALTTLAGQFTNGIPLPPPRDELSGAER